MTTSKLVNGAPVSFKPVKQPRNRLGSRPLSWSALQADKVAVKFWLMMKVISLGFGKRSQARDAEFSLELS
jgi:hypothetical protein